MTSRERAPAVLRYEGNDVDNALAAKIGFDFNRQNVFARDRAAVDVERLRPLLELGGYIPCPDHRIAPGAEYDLVRHYCGRMHEVFD
ncbi:MAG: hypothetical protein ABIF82_01575 [Planctomycetota bacterium]